MVVTCPSCKRKYRIEENRIRAPFQKMRCSKCGHVFVYQKPGSVAPTMEEDAIQLPDEAETKEKKKSSKGHKGILISALAVLVVAAIGVGLYIYWQNYLGAGDRWLSIRKVEGQEIVVKDGRVFFITGTIANGSTKARKYVTLRAKLFDREGKVLTQQDALAGMALPREEVQQMRRAEIERKVSEFRLLAIETFMLDRHKELPFSITFFDDFEKAKEFTVEIIESPLL